MSLPVDRQERRAEVALAGYEIVADHGLEMLTVRAVANQMGCSTAVVSHYFTNKRDLLVAVYRLAAGMTFERWDAEEATGSGVAACLAAVLPLDDNLQRHWRVHLAFWSAAVVTRELGQIQIEVLRQSVKNVRRLLEREPEVTKLTANDLDHLSRQLLSMQMGVATQALFETQIVIVQQQASQLKKSIGILISNCKE